MLFLIVIISACTTNATNENNENSTQGMPTATPEKPPPVEVIGDCLVEGHFPDRTTCTSVSVSCANLPETTAELRTTPHNPNSTFLGTIILGSGGTGQSFLSGDIPTTDTPALNIILQLADAGYTVVERKWLDGWFGSGSEGFGILDPACRHAELLTWLDEQAESPGAICAFGNSGGSSEIAYGLTRWNTESVLDAVILGGGPPMARLDIGCLGFDHDPNWEQTCTETWNTTQTECQRPQPVCTLYDRRQATGPQEIDAAFSIAELNKMCTGSSPTFSAVFEENSILFPGADLSYPNTPVHFIYGRQDCTEAATLGPLYLEAITTETSVEYLESVPHTVQNSPAGAEAIINAILNTCQVPQ